MSRSEQIESHIGNALSALHAAKTARDAASVAMGENPDNSEAHEALDAAINKIGPLEAKVEALKESLKRAKEMDKGDVRKAQISEMRAARDEAVQLSAARTEQAKALEKAVKSVAEALAGFEKANDAVLLKVYEATQHAAPGNPGSHDHTYFQALISNLSLAVTRSLCDAFGLALYDAGVGRVGVPLDGFIEFINPTTIAQQKREGIVAAVKKATKALEWQIDDLHKRTRVIGGSDDGPGDEEHEEIEPMSIIDTVYRVNPTHWGDPADVKPSPPVEWGLTPGVTPVPSSVVQPPAVRRTGGDFEGVDE